MAETLAQIAQAPGAFLTDVIGLLGNDSLGASLAIAMLVAGLVATVFVAYRTQARLREALLAIAVIETSRDAHGFAKQFEAISAQIEASPLMRAPWLRFKSTLVHFRNGASAAAVIQCTSPASEFFSLRGIRESWRDYRGLPGLFLSLSLLLTVIGVAASMSTAIKTVEDGRTASIAEQAAAARAGTPQSIETKAEAAPMQDALRQLLNAGRTSFSVAIVGLFISLLLTATQRMCAARLSAALAAFNRALQDRVGVVSFEAVVLERLAGVASGAVHSGSPLETATSEDLRLALEQALPQHIDFAVERLQTAIDQNWSDGHAAQNAALASLKDELGQLLEARVAHPVSSMTEQMQEQMLGVRGHLVGLSKLLNDTSAARPSGEQAADRPKLGMSAVVQAIERSNDKLAASSSHAVRELGDELSARIAADVSIPVQSMATMIAELQSDMASLRSQQPQPLNDHADAMHPDLVAGLVDELQRLQEAIRQSGADITMANSLANERLFAEFAERIEAGIAQTVEGLAAPLSEVHSSLRAVSSSVAAKDSATDERSSGDLSRLQSEIALLRIAVEDSNQRLADESRSAFGDLFAALDRRLADGVQADERTLQSISSLREEIGRLDAAMSSIRDLRGSHKDAVAATAPLQDIVADVRAAIAAGHDKIARENLDAANALAEFINQRLEASVAGPMQGLSDTLGSVAADLPAAIARASGVSSREADAIASLGKELKQVSDDLRGAIAALSTRAVGVAGDDKASRALVEEVRRSITELAQASRQLEHSGAAIAERLGRVIEAAPASLSREAEAAANSVRSAAESFNGLAALFVERLEGQVARAIDVRLAGTAEGGADDIRLATEEMRDALVGLTTQAQAEWDQARSALVDEIRQAIEVLGGVGRRWDQSGSEVANRLQQVLEAAPVNWSRESETAARTVLTAAELARTRLEQTVAALAETTTRDSLQTTAALTKISEQLVRQSAHTRDALANQLSATVSGIERASQNIALAIESLSAGLSQGTQAATADVLDKLVSASAELHAVTQKSSSEAAHSVEVIWNAATEARNMISTDLEQIRERLVSQAEQVNTAAIDKLNETAAEIAASMTNYGGNLSVTVDTLVQTLQALSQEMGQLKTTMALEEGGDLQLAAHATMAVNDGTLPSRRRIASRSSQQTASAPLEHDAPLAASPPVFDAQRAEAAINHFLANRPASVRTSGKR